MALFAHVLAPASMGMVVILGTWLRLVEMVTDLSVDRYLLRGPTAHPARCSARRMARRCCVAWPAACSCCITAAAALGL